jgi:hypothetical protein
MGGGLWKREIILGSPDGAPKRTTLDTDATSRFAREFKKHKER